MNILDYLNDQTEHIARGKGRVREYRVFDFNYMPPEPLMRSEAKPIIDASVRYLASNIPNHVFVFGSRGCGKTMMMKHIGSLLRQHHRATVLYANCRQHNTSFKLLAELLGERPRGLSLDELWYRFCALYKEPLILILDEVDLLSDKDRNKDLLYLLGRSPTNPMVVLLSNSPRFLSSLDESIRSSLQPEVVHFRNYAAWQIRDILMARARIGLTKRPTPVINELAALTARFTNSDIRVAIKTLYAWALEPERDLRTLFDRAKRDLVTDVLKDLNDRNLLIVKAAAASPDRHVKEVYRRYRQLSRQLHEEPFSYAYFYTTLSYLQSIGLLVLLSTKVGRAYTNRIQLLFDESVLEGVWGARF